jgi:hypothetical protein
LKYLGEDAALGMAGSVGAAMEGYSAAMVRSVQPVDVIEVGRCRIASVYCFRHFQRKKLLVSDF